MMVKSTQSLYLPITSKVVVYAPAERANTLPLFLLYPFMHSVECNYSVVTVEVHTTLIIGIKTMGNPVA